FNSAAGSHTDSSLLGNGEKVLRQPLLDIPKCQGFNQLRMMSHFMGQESGHVPEDFRILAAKLVHVALRHADDCAPRVRRVEEDPKCVTVLSMREGPSEPACRSRFQTTSGGCGQNPWS